MSDESKKLVAVRIDPDLCAGTQMCMGVDPVNFTLNDLGQAQFSGDLRDPGTIEEAAEVCPMAAILLTYKAE